MQSAMSSRAGWAKRAHGRLPIPNAQARRMWAIYETDQQTSCGMRTQSCGIRVL